jgi:hypothetical protein
MKLISGLTLLVSRKGPNMLNQISFKPIMDVAIMQIFCYMHELLQRCHPCRWLTNGVGGAAGTSREKPTAGAQKTLSLANSDSPATLMPAVMHYPWCIANSPAINAHTAGA